VQALRASLSQDAWRSPLGMLLSFSASSSSDHCASHLLRMAPPIEKNAQIVNQPIEARGSCVLVKPLFSLLQCRK
jgi:hypothetical protein